MDTLGNKMNKALLISYYFPPDNTIAAVRIGKFAKYLPEFGWEPLILTVDNHSGIAKTLPVEIDESKIIRTPYYAVNELFSRSMKKGASSGNAASPKTAALSGSITSKIVKICEPVFQLPVIEKLFFDPMGWYKPAVKAGLEIIKSNNIKVLFSSYGPSLPHIIAARLHRETGLPWVADYRDDWIDEYRKHPQPLHFFDQRWEKHTLKTCNAIVSHNQPLATILETSHHRHPTIIPNGFDQTDFEDIVPLTPEFTITYTGYIYPGKRDPSPVFQALAEARHEGRITPEALKLRFYGQNVSEFITPLMLKYHVEDFVVVGGNVPYKESLTKQMESTILLLLSWNDLRDAGTLTGKIYEYLGAHRPVLALAYPNGEIDKLLQKSGCGIVANDPAEIKRIIVTWFDEFRRTGRIRSYYYPNENIINVFTRKEQARVLAEVFNKVSG
jgi:hypothetical protein